MNTATFIVIVIMVALLALAFNLYKYLLRRATRNVIKTFRKFNATSPEKALPLELMGLRSSVPMFSFRILRDYRPYAVQLLSRLGVIRNYLNNYYLSEETLNTANLAI